MNREKESGALLSKINYPMISIEDCASLGNRIIAMAAKRMAA